MRSLNVAEFSMSRRAMDKVASFGIIGNEFERFPLAPKVPSVGSLMRKRQVVTPPQSFAPKGPSVSNKRHECQRILCALPGLCAAKVTVVSMGDLAVIKVPAGTGPRWQG